MAFCLYLGLPRRELDDQGQTVQTLAKAIDRSPNAVALKIWNIAAHDANRIAAGHKSMPHTSKLDKQIWDDYAARGDEFLEDCLRLLPENVAGCVLNSVAHESESTLEQTVDELFEHVPTGGVRQAMQVVRINQSYFRNSLVENYQGRCALTGLAIPSLLVASHIKLWAASDPHEKTMASNGILLNALHDAAFDKGLITFDDNCRMIVSHQAVKHTDATDRWLYAFEGNMLRMPEASPPDPLFLTYHRSHIFQGAV